MSVKRSKKCQKRILNCQKWYQNINSRTCNFHDFYSDILVYWHHEIWHFWPIFWYFWTEIDKLTFCQLTFLLSQKNIWIQISHFYQSTIFLYFKISGSCLTELLSQKLLMTIAVSLQLKFFIHEFYPMRSPLIESKWNSGVQSDSVFDSTETKCWHESI